MTNVLEAPHFVPEAPAQETVYAPVRFDSHRDTLGREIVLTANKHANAVSASPAESLVDANELKRSLRYQVDQLRDTVLGFGPNEIEALGESFWDCMPDFQKLRFIDEHENDMPIRQRNQELVHWLFERRSDDMVHVTPDQEKAFKTQEHHDDQRILNLLQAHNDQVHNRQQDPEFKRAVSEARAQWLEGVNRGVAEGWLDNSVLDRAVHHEGVPVYEGDRFSTYLTDTLGTHFPLTGEIVLGKDFEPITLIHEFNHAVTTAPGIENTVLDNHWINEALTEHIAQAMAEDTPIEVINPEVGIYSTERKMLQTIIDLVRRGGEELSVYDFTRAYSMNDIAKRKELLKSIQDKMRATIPSVVWEKHDDPIDTLQGLIDYADSDDEEGRTVEILAVLERSYQSQ